MSEPDVPRLPESPDLEQERKRAKELLKAMRAGDGAAVARFRSGHPRFARMTPDALHEVDVKLSDAQWVIAREYGFASWPAFRAHIDTLVPKDAPPLNEENEIAVGSVFPCRYERHLRSIGRSFPASVTFSNLSSRNISTFWLDYNGERVACRTLAGSYSYRQPTYISHPWVVVDAAGRCLGIVLPGSTTRIVTISEKSITAGGGADLKEMQETLYCSFCGKSQHEVRKLVAGPTVFICDECIKLCDIVVDPALTPEQAEAVAAPARGRADAVPTELLLVRLRFLNALFERQRADVEETVNRLRQREVSWAAMGAAIGVSPQAAQDLFSRLSASSA